MKFLPQSRWFLLALAAATLGACSSEEKPAVEAKSSSEVNYESCGEVYRDADFSPWMSRAELQWLQKQTVQGQYFSHIQGRNNKGRNEFRALVRPFPSDEYEEWAVFWGLTESELYDWETRLLSKGFQRHSMQIFPDPTGKSLHQIVWLKPHNAPVADIPPPPASKKPEVTAPPQPTAAVEEIPAADQDDPNPLPTESPVVQSPETESAAEHPPVAIVVEPGPAAEKPPVSASPTPASPQPSLLSEIEAAKPHTSATAEPTSTHGKEYSVVKGDSLARIARRHKVSVEALKEANQLKSDALSIGQKLRIPER